MASNTITSMETSKPDLLHSGFESVESLSTIDRSKFQAVDRTEFQQWAAGSYGLTSSTIDENELQNVATAASEPMPIPIEKLYVEDFIIVWLDANIGQSDDARKTIEKLRLAANDIHTFTDRVACIEFISQIKNEQIFLIVSGSLGQETVPYVNHLPQIEAIYIFCANLEKHLQWARNYRKVNGVFTEIEPLCEQISRRIQRVTHDLIGFHVVGKSSTNQQEASFMYAQLFQEILLDMDPNRCNIEEMVEFSRVQYAENPRELEWISKFEQHYVPQSSVWWYTLETFIYKMLNKALRTQEIKTMYALRFFIRHLHNQLVQLNKQFSVGDRMHLYRGQGMLIDEFGKLTANQGGLVSFPNFVSTSTDKEVARRFALMSLNDANKVVILMTIIVDQSMTGNVPFASIDKFSSYSNIEREWLFSMGSVFRIGKIERHDDGIWSVHLTLTRDTDPQLESLKKHMRNKIKDTDSLIKLGIVQLEKRSA